MPTFGSLPNEVQQMIFRSLYSLDLCECVSVCKSWKLLSQEALYAIINLQSYTCAEKFVKTLKKNRYLRRFVIQLVFSFLNDLENCKMNSTIAKLFSYLSNLERIDFSDNELFFKLLLDALLLNQLLKLKYIDMLCLDGEKYLYTTCAILLKDRLRNLSIEELNEDDEKSEVADDSINSDELSEEESNEDYNNESEFNSDSENSNDKYQFCENTYNETTDEDSVEEETDFISTIQPSIEYPDKIYRLLNNLHLFRNLEVIYIQKKPENIIDLIEKLTLNCPHLQRMDINFTSNIESNGSTLVDLKNSKVSNSILVSKVSHLEFSVRINSQLVCYIMRKFPQLELLKFPTASDLNETTFSQFLTYLSKIRHIAVSNNSHIIHGQYTLINYINSLWDITFQSRVLSIELQYHHSFFNMNGMEMELENTSNVVKIRYCPSVADGDIIEKYGSHIVYLKLSGLRPGLYHHTKSLGEREIPYKVLRPLEHCARLKQFSIDGCLLTEANVSGYEQFRKHTLDSLHLIDCVMESSAVFKLLSSLFTRINYLKLSELQPNNIKSDGSELFEDINMAETNIGKLSLSRYRNSNRIKNSLDLLIHMYQKISSVNHYIAASS